MSVLLFVPHLITGCFRLCYSALFIISHSFPSALAFCHFLISITVVPLQTPEELDDSDFETEDFDVRSRTSVQTEDDQLIAGQSARVSCTVLWIVFISITELGHICYQY